MTGLVGMNETAEMLMEVAERGICMEIGTEAEATAVESGREAVAMVVL